ncbi:ABC transporter ATP-binding protein [Pectinatus cerevisiiphilus]|uniref:ATP-binding cassette subfamily B protein n=1 Tax=Pectinatus cerevisiiphilus TaxID=86956 RepID=A0A4R3KAD8_9FIRM|nr:ABC transporter ATP-binding protein [Pectinatus cerevisiiphilus]TCS79611.1 ATP-binding cassette subfamily B protein [Pectinatus cerevisiiphilus]
MVRSLLAAYRPYKGVLCFIILGSFIGAGLELLFPLCIRHIMNDYLPTGNLKLLGAAAGLLLALYGLSYLISCAVFYYGRSMGAKIEYDLRGHLFQHVMNMSFSYFDNARTGQLISRLINDIAEIGELMFSIPHLLIVCVVTMLGTISLLFWVNWLLASVVSILLVLKAVEAVRVNRRMKASFMEARKETGKLTVRVSESLDAVRLVKVFGNEALELEKLLIAGRELLKVQRRSFRIVGKMNSSLSFFSNGTNLVIVVLGGLFAEKGIMQLSDLVTFLLYMVIFMKPVFQLTLLTEVYQRGMAGYQRYQELMAEESAPSVQSLPEKTRLQGAIYFKDVSFAYNDRQPVLQHFDLAIRPGELVAVVGPTGSGKSTLCQLLLRLYELDGGSIEIDGMDIQKYSLAALRNGIGIVQQDVFLFSDSIRDNIAYGRPNATMEEIVTAAHRACAHEFISALPEGYATCVGERGVKLSGGQKQRIAIARIFLKNPPILILDEATSALDNETEQQVRQAMYALSKKRTTLVVAHRLASVQDADRILVLTKGQITEQGTHTELMGQQGLYYDLYMAQFREK